MRLKMAVPGNAELISILKGAAIAAVATIATYVIQHAGPTDFGQYTPMVVGVLSVLVNALRKSVSVDIGGGADTDTAALQD